MINMIKLGFTPKACCWVHRRGQAQGILAVYAPSFSPVFAAYPLPRQLGTEFWGYTAIRWPWGWETIGDSGDAPSVPGSFNGCTSLELVFLEGHDSLTL